jgi:predicted YcjX-like family ATPase
LVLTTLADGLTRGVESVGDRISETFFEPVIRLGVTGLSRAGKTVFITSLVANLLERKRMPGLLAARDGRIEAAFLQPQPDDTIPRFEFETHLGALTGPEPSWPESTRNISELRLSMRVRPTGLLSGLSGPRTVHLDIVDYPGEWLLDLGLLEKDYRTWSQITLDRMKNRDEAHDYLAVMQTANALDPLDEPEAQKLAQSFTAYLHAARAVGFSDCSPGRFLLPGDLEGSPVLTFAPLEPQSSVPRKSLWREMERRYEAYKARVVKPFFRDHFARIDRQIVLVDVLGAIHSGPAAVEDLRQAMGDILGAFRPGQNGFLSQILRGRRVDRLLFAATKADHLHHSQHARMSAIMEALLTDARRRADFAGAETQALAIAALRTTTEETRKHDGKDLDCVRGVLLNEDGTRGKTAAFYPGDLPQDPAHLLQPAQSGASKWLDGEYQAMRFAPAQMSLKPGEGPPHIRLDRTAQFLIGDRI